MPRRSMRFLTIVTLLPVTTLFAISLGLSFEYDEVKPSYVSRRDIDGTRGRKYFNPEEDGFLDDYGYDKGQYLGTREIHDIRSNVPGEPGIDYPAYVKIPMTMFSCINRKRGYYADEEAGCQVFHVCEDSLVSSFLCPVGSLFSQQLLTCDWWSRVSCTESHKFYNQQSHSTDTLLTDSNMLRQALSETLDYQKMQPTIEKMKENEKRNLTSMSIRRNENQLESNHDARKSYFRDRDYKPRDIKTSNSTITKLHKDLSLIRIKSLIEEKRRSKNREHSRLSISNRNQVKSKNQEKAFKYFTSTRSNLLLTKNDEQTTVTEDTIFSKENNINYETTIRPFESFTKQYENTTNINSLSNLSAKANLDRKKIKNSQNFSKHNFGYEYDEMEGTESIDFINSQAERNFEKERNIISLIPDSNNQKNKSRISIIFNNTISKAKLQQKHINQPTEQFEAKESIGLIQYNIPGQLEHYDKQKHKVTEDLHKDTDQTITKIKNSAEERITDVPFQYKTEASTLLFDTSTEPSTVGTNIDSYTNDDNKDILHIMQSHQVPRNPVFQLALGNNETFNFTDTPLITTIPINYKYVLNSTDIPFTDTILPITIPNLEQTTLSTYAKQFSDTLQESNSPLEVTFPLNNDRNFTNVDSKNPIELEILRRLIYQQDNQPINFEDLEIVRSAQINQKIKTNENPDVIESTTTGTNPQNLKLNQMEQNDRQALADNVPPSKLSESQFNFLNNENNPFKFHQTLPQIIRNQHYTSIASTQLSQENKKYNPIYQERPRGFQTIEANREKLGRLTNFNVQEFLPLSDISNLANRKQPVYSNRYLNQQKTAYTNVYPKHWNNNRYNNNKEENYDGNNQVNYQTNHYPENLVHYKQNTEENFNYYNDDNFNFRNPEIQQNYKNYRNNENDQNSKNQDKTLNLQNENREKINRDYFEYDNYKNAEEISEISPYVDFGNRIIKKNRNTNIAKPVENKQKIMQNFNKYKINSDILGKGVNFLWTMSQLIENDRSSRPLNPANGMFEQNSNNKNKKLYNTDPQDNINFDNINSFKEISRNNNINNNNKYYYNNFKVNESDLLYNYRNINQNTMQNFTDARHNINMENFSKFERLPFFNKISKTIDNVEPLLGLDNQKTFNEPGDENYSTTHSVPDSSYQILPNFESHVNAHDIPKLPELNVFNPFNNNQQPSKISQSTFNGFKPEHYQLSNKNIKILNDPRLQLIHSNLYKNAQTNFENIHLGDKDIHVHPESIDYNFDSTTQQSSKNSEWPQKNSQITQEGQSERNDHHYEPTIFTTETNIRFHDFTNDNIKYNETELPTTGKSLVETEFIPSISFDFGSDEGMKEYLEALRKGLVTNDNDATTVDRQSNFSMNSQTETKEKIRSKKSKNSKITNNFTD